LLVYSSNNHYKKGLGMLVLNLYDLERLHIGDNNTLTIDRCVDDGNATRIGIEAPREVSIMRAELVDDDAT